MNIYIYIYERVLLTALNPVRLIIRRFQYSINIASQET